MKKISNFHQPTNSISVSNQIDFNELAKIKGGLGSRDIFTGASNSSIYSPDADPDEEDDD